MISAKSIFTYLAQLLVRHYSQNPSRIVGTEGHIFEKKKTISSLIRLDIRLPDNLNRDSQALVWWSNDKDLSLRKPDFIPKLLAYSTEETFCLSSLFDLTFQ